MKAPQAVALRNSLGNVLKDTGALDESLAEYRKALQLQPLPEVYSNYLYTLQYHPTIDPGEVFREHREFDRLFALPLFSPSMPYANDADPRVPSGKVGYISTDFRSHALGQYLTPLFENRDHAAFEIFCYSNVLTEDVLTFRSRDRSDHWKNIRRLSDAEVATLVRTDRIDVLIDLHQHMGGNRIFDRRASRRRCRLDLRGIRGRRGCR